MITQPAGGRVRLFGVVAFWILFGAICGMQVWLSMITHGHSLLRVTLCHTLVWIAWIPISFAIAALALRVPLFPLRRRNVLDHLLVGCVVTLLHAAWWVGLVLAIRPFDAMNPTDFWVTFARTGFYQMPLELLLYTLVAGAAWLDASHAAFRERELRAAQLEQRLAEARLHALELQIQPHFLFNTLNAISALVRTGQTQQAVGMISGLSDLLRYALERAGDQRVSIEDEVEMLRRYLEIQRLRFPDRLSFEIDIESTAQRAAVPVLLLQPLAENAIRHGIARTVGPGRVHVRAYRAEGTLHIEMRNSGHLDRPLERGIGLSNTVARLEQLYGAAHSLELDDDDDGVLTRVRIPWTEVA